MVGQDCNLHVHQQLLSAVKSPAHRGNVVVVAVSEEASAGGGLLGRPPLMPASQAESGDGKHRGS